MKKVTSYLSKIILATLVTQSSSMGMEEELSPLKSILGKPLAHLQKMEAVIEFPWMPQTLGNTLNVINGELKVTAPLIEAEQQVLMVYKELDAAITIGTIITTELIVDAKSIQSGCARCTGGTAVKLTGQEDFIAGQTLFGSKGNIELTSPTFSFSTCFIDVDPNNTILKIIPHPSVNSPIEFIRIAPKKSPLFIQGKIDFKTLSFSNFIVSHSDFYIKFRK